MTSVPGTFVSAVFPQGGAADLAWQDRALCQYVDPEIFYPEKGGSVTQPKRVCRACEVRPQCLGYALGNHDIYGIWGGFSYCERRDVARQHQSGRPLEDIIADDEAEFYVSSETSADRKARYLAQEREQRRVKAERLAAAAKTQRPQETAA